MSGLKIRICIYRVTTMIKWSVYKAFEKATKAHNPAHLLSPIVHIYEEQDAIPIKEWEDALIKAANFVERWGVKYLPLFERVENELKKSREQLHTLEKVKNIANGDLSSVETLTGQQSYFIEP